MEIVYQKSTCMPASPDECSHNLLDVEKEKSVILLGISMMGQLIIR